MKKSAGILVYKKEKDKLLVFLVHPGGPFWAKKDLGAWSVPKGEFSDEEEGFTAARREFAEETGHEIEGEFIELTPCKQPSRKVKYAWAVDGDIDENNIKSNEFEMEWPPKSGQTQRFPEVDRGSWFSIGEATKRILRGQVPILEELSSVLDIPIDFDVEEPPESQGELF